MIEKLAFRSLCSIVSLPGLGAAFSPTLCQPWAPSCTRPCSGGLGLPWVPFLNAPPRDLPRAPLSQGSGSAHKWYLRRRGPGSDIAGPAPTSLFPIKSKMVTQRGELEASCLLLPLLILKTWN